MLQKIEAKEENLKEREKSEHSEKLAFPSGKMETAV